MEPEWRRITRISADRVNDYDCLPPRRDDLELTKRLQVVRDTALPYYFTFADLQHHNFIELEAC